MAGIDDKAKPAETSNVDPGAHYRGPNLFGIPLDPYRVIEAYPNIVREPARHMLKKILRMGKKGITEQQLVAELRCCLERWEKMLLEEQKALLPIGEPERQVLDAPTLAALIAEYQKQHPQDMRNMQNELAELRATQPVADVFPAITPDKLIFKAAPGYVAPQQKIDTQNLG